MCRGRQIMICFSVKLGLGSKIVKRSPAPGTNQIARFAEFRPLANWVKKITAIIYSPVFISFGWASNNQLFIVTLLIKTEFYKAP